MEDNNIKKEECIRDCVMDKISSEHLKPTNKWYFKVRHATLWVPGILITIFGAFAFAGILYSTLHSGWEYRQYTHRSTIGFLTQAIPLVWVLTLVVFGSFIVKITRFTISGYKYKTVIILLVSFLISIFLGSGIFALDTFVKSNPFMRSQTENFQRRLWSNPEEGRLLGAVISIEGIVTVEDTNNKIWIVNIEQANKRNILSKGETFRFLGEKQDDNVFAVCRVLPWELSPVKIHPKRENVDRLKKIDPRSPSNCDLSISEKRKLQNERKPQQLSY